MRLDDLDRQIVAYLLDDARASYAQVGSRVGLSAPAVKRRVDRLRQDGVITGYSAVVDPAALGWTTEAFIELFCSGATSPEEIYLSVRKHPEVVAAYTVTGEASALVHLRARDIQHLERALERLRAEPNITRTKTSIVLSRLIGRPNKGPEDAANPRP
ncbi:MAG TPA: Lrp/AsnC family transcriptional regulator [Streptosporangiaceae bacterium]|nr:Lrp/AsnC family transcriptional regulator [Streptosporangiaceae bacterium]